MMTALLLYYCEHCDTGSVEHTRHDTCNECGNTLHIVSAYNYSSTICEECGDELAADERTHCTECLEADAADETRPCLACGEQTTARLICTSCTTK